MSVTKLDNDHTELHDNLIEVQRWKRQGFLRFAAVIVLIFAVGSLLLTAAVSIGSLGTAAIYDTLGAEPNGISGQGN